MTLGHVLHDLHGELVVVHGNVGLAEHRSALMLAGGHLVVLGLGVDAQLPQLLVQIRHEGLDAGTNGAEIVVFHLLTFGRIGAEEGASGEDQIGTLGVVLGVHQEVLLLHADGGYHALGLLAEELEHPAGLVADGVHGAQQRGLLIQHLAGVAAKRGGDIEGIVLNKGIAGGVPGRVSSGLEGGAQAAGGEAGGVGLALHQLLAGKLHDDAAAIRGGKEAVVLFRVDSRHGLEPVGEMGGALLNGPILHGVGHHAGHMGRQSSAFRHGFLQRLINALGQVGAHDLVVEHHTSKQFRDVFHRNFLLIPSLHRHMPQEISYTKRRYGASAPQRPCCLMGVVYILFPAFASPFLAHFIF